jgi:hypothetical protein
MSRRDPDPYGIQNSELERIPYCTTCGAEPRTIHLILCPGACARLFCARCLAEHICQEESAP